jgi:hypothetical protein
MACGCYKELRSLIRKINESNVPKLWSKWMYTHMKSLCVYSFWSKKNFWINSIDIHSSYLLEFSCVFLRKATFQNYDPNECIPIDKIKPNLQNKYFCSDSFVDDTNQAPPDIPWWIGALLSNIHPVIGIFFVIINGLK